MPTARISHEFFDIQIHVTTSKRISVLQVIMVLLHLLPKLIKRLMKMLQEQWITEDLGPHGTVGNLFSERSLSCPECGSPKVNRKDWRSRKPVVPVLGEIEIPQRRVKCRECETVYKPYEDDLGLPKGTQYTPEVLVRGIQNALMMSYERASVLTGGSPSAGRIHRAVKELKPEVNDEDEEYTLVIIDATDVPKWRESGQISLTLAHEISRGPQVYGRGTLKRSIVAVAAGQEEDIKAFLEGPRIQAVMHDGKLNMEELCEVDGRCMWHVVYTVHHLLYRDGITGEQNTNKCESLFDILFDPTLSPGECAAKMLDWVEDQRPVAPQAARHVEHALDGVMNVKSHSELFDVLTTSCMERMMVELNKRFENGGGWTPQGAEALLSHLQLWLYEPEQWIQHVLPNEELAWPDFVYNSHI